MTASGPRPDMGQCESRRLLHSNADAKTAIFLATRARFWFSNDNEKANAMNPSWLRLASVLIFIFLGTVVLVCCP